MELLALNRRDISRLSDCNGTIISAQKTIWLMSSDSFMRVLTHLTSWPKIKIGEGGIMQWWKYTGELGQ